MRSHRESESSGGGWGRGGNVGHGGRRGGGTSFTPSSHAISACMQWPCWRSLRHSHPGRGGRRHPRQIGGPSSPNSGRELPGKANRLEHAVRSPSLDYEWESELGGEGHKKKPDAKLAVELAHQALPNSLLSLIECPTDGGGYSGALARGGDDLV